MPNRPRKYWIVKHGLDALAALPHSIWRTGETAEPTAFRRVRPSDRWIGFAYAESDARERALSLVTGFSECTGESHYEPIPERVRKRIGGRSRKAWFIHGKPTGWQPKWPVGVPTLDELLGRKTYRQSTLIDVSASEFERIRGEVKQRQFDPAQIPVLGREPRNEQEVLAIAVGSQQQLGIEEILRVRTGFPDMLVKLRRKAQPVHVELELYSQSYLAHGHGERVNRENRYKDITTKPSGELPLILLCWIHDADSKRLKREGKVTAGHVFELQSMLRAREPIRI